MSDVDEPQDEAATEATRQAAIRYVQGLMADPEPKPKPRKVFPPEQGRLGDRRPEFAELSAKLAEVNKRSHSHHGESL